jgi:hypothetical protein
VSGKQRDECVWHSGCSKIPSPIMYNRYPECILILAGWLFLFSAFRELVSTNIFL